MSSKRIVTAARLSPWGQGYADMRDQLTKLIYLSLAGMSIPYFLMQFMQTKVALDQTEPFVRSPLNQATQAWNWYLLKIQDFFGSWLAVTVVPALLILLGFLVVYRAILMARAEEKLSDTIITAAKKLPTVFFSWVLIIGIILGVFALGALLPGLLIFLQLSALAIGTLSIAIPFYVFCGTKALPALKLSLKMDYCRAGGINRFSVFFQIFTFQVLASLLIELLFLLKSGLQSMTSFSLKVTEVGGFNSGSPLGLWYQLIEFVYLGLSGFVLAACLSFTLSFILRVLSYRRIEQAT